MRKSLLLLLISLVVISCKNKELCEDGSCGNTAIKVVVNWEDRVTQARAMRMNIFSQTNGELDYGRDNIPAGGEKYISLNAGTSHIPLCYDYNANVQFRSETSLDQFVAYCAEATRVSYNTLATPVPGEVTIADPDDEFYVHSWQNTFYVEYYRDTVQVLNFYPENKLYRFTYRINNILGAQYISDARGAASGMAATYIFKTDALTTVRSTILFEKGVVRMNADGTGYIEGSFCTFGPVMPCQNRFTIELMAGNTNYYTAYWNVSTQMDEVMTNRAAKLARDGYDILIENNPTIDIPEIPDPGEDPDPGSGFEIDVEDWDVEDIYL